MSKGLHWKNKEDLILVETLTEYIAKGISIYESFPTIVDRLKQAGYSRTIKACQSRWTNHLQKIYGDAIQLAAQKQQENAKKIVESMLENQGDLQVIPEGEAKVELLVPYHRPDLTINASNTNNTPMSSSINSLQDAINFMTNFQLKYDSLQKDHNDLLEELEKTWEENERLRLEISQLQELQQKYELAGQIIKKLESVSM